jgi:WD40 repeat protein
VLASGGADGTVRLFDLTAPAEGRPWARPGTSFYDLAYSPDGAWLATAAEGGVVRLYDVKTGRVGHTLRGHAESPLNGRDSNRVTRLAFAPDGKTLATGGNDSRVMLWEVASGRRRADLEGRPADRAVVGSQTVGSLAFSPDGLLLAAGFGAPTYHQWNEYDQVVKVWQVDTLQEIHTLRGHRNNVSDVAFTRDGKTLISAASDHMVRFWDVGSGTELRKLTVVDRWSAMALSPDGQTLASGNLTGGIGLRDAATGTEKHGLRTHSHQVARLAFTPDGRTLASASWDRTVRLWDVASGREMRALRGHEGLVQCVAFSPDGNTLACGGWDGALRLWQAATAEEIAAMLGQGHE